MQIRSFPGRFDPLCPATLVLMNRETIPSPTGLTCKPCATPMPDSQPCCLYNCFQLGTTIVTITGTPGGLCGVAAGTFTYTGKILPRNDAANKCASVFTTGVTGEKLVPTSQTYIALMPLPGGGFIFMISGGVINPNVDGTDLLTFGLVWAKYYGTSVTCAGGIFTFDSSGIDSHCGTLTVTWPTTVAVTGVAC